MEFAGEIDIADNDTSYCYIPFSGLEFSKTVDMKQILTAFNGNFLAGYARRKYSETQIPYGCGEFSDESLFVSMLHEDYDVACRVYPPRDNMHGVYFRKVDLEKLGLLPDDSEDTSRDTASNQEINEIFRDVTGFWDTVLKLKKENPKIEHDKLKNKLISGITGTQKAHFRSYIDNKKLMKYVIDVNGRDFIMAIVKDLCDKNETPIEGDKRKLYTRLKNLTDRI